MIVRTSHSFYASLLCITTIMVAACGGGSSSTTAPTPASTVITGTASKGTLKNAIITAYAVTSSGQKGDKIGNTRTDSKGGYSLAFTGYTGPVFLELTSDADTKMTCDVPSGCGSSTFGQDVASTLTLSSVVPAATPGSPITTAITPFTHLAAEEAKAKGLNKANIEASLTQVASLFNLPPLNQTQPIDITVATNFPTASEDAQRYALLNAAIGQLAGGSTTDVNAKLNAIATTLHSNGGQIKNRSSNQSEIDLQDILSAANTVTNSPSVSSNISTLIKSVIGEDLHTAETALIDSKTEATSAPLPGADDLVKAKAFVTSAHNLIQSIRSIDHDSNFQTQLTEKYAPVVDILDSTDDDFVDRLPKLIEATSVIAGKAIEACLDNCTNIDNTINNQIQTILDQNFNTSGYYGLQTIATNVTGSNGVRVTATQDTSSTTITLNGSFKIKQVENGCVWNWHSYTCTPYSTPVGQEVTYTLTNFKITHPLLSVVQKTHALTLLKDSKISSPNRYIKLGADSGLEFQFANATSVDQFINAVTALNGPAWDIAPTSASLKLSQVTLGATATSVNFVGNIGFTLNKVKLPSTANTTESVDFILPSQAQLSGTFNGLNGDALTASLTLTLDTAKSNPLRAPEDGYVRKGLFSYSYNSSAKIAILNTITPTNATLGSDYWHPLTYHFALKTGWCWSSQNALVYSDPNDVFNSYDRWIGCTSKSTVYEALQEQLANNYGQIGVQINNEGFYVPSVTGKTLTTSNLILDGTLDWSDGSFNEDSTHFASGALSLQASVQLSAGNTTHSANIRLDASRNGFEDATGKLTLTLEGKSITLTAPVIGGKPSFTLSDSNGASVDIGLTDTNEDAELMISGKKMGIITTLAGLPVVRFVDNSLIAL